MAARTPHEIQEWNDAQVARFAQPDGTIEIIRGREWARVRPMRCPWCHMTFYAWAPLDAPGAPHVEDIPPGHGMGARQTCGHPLCWKHEDEHQFRRRRTLTTTCTTCTT